jgi:molybdopterin/thiamine biosynthesis adenylyltransferase
LRDDVAYSRPLATAARLGDKATDLHRFPDKRVLLTGEEGVLSTSNGRECLLDCLRLLVRISGDVSVWLPAGCGGLLAAAKAESGRISFRLPVRFLDDVPDYAAYDAVLCVGATPRPELPWTVVNSNGWLVRVSSGTSPLSPETGQYNPIAALAAACLGVTDVFKRLLGVIVVRGPLFDGLSFSLLTYQAGKTDPGPPLPEKLPLDLLIVGVGAIGNGVVHLLNMLPVKGRAWVLDRQTFQPENLGTCLLIGPEDLEKQKAHFAETFLSPRLQVRGFSEDLSSFRKRLGTEVPHPALVLNGLDNIDARHEVQGMWPDLIIDGAIGDFGCQVSRHSWVEDTACLMCLFPRETGEPAEQVASRVTGLRPERAAQMLELVTEEDVVAAPEDKRDWLKARVGKQICSVVPEGLAQSISMERQREGFEPSVPFVACLSACMMVTELVREVAGWGSPLEPRFQFDVLQGPTNGQHFPQARQRNCECVTRQANIDKVRKQRHEGRVAVS